MSKKAELYIEDELVGYIELNWGDMFHVGGSIDYLASFENYRPIFEEFHKLNELLDAEDQMNPEERGQAYKKLYQMEEKLSELGLFVKPVSGKPIEIDPVSIALDGDISYRA